MKKIWWLVIAIFVLLSIIIFYPKESGYESGGKLLIGMEVTKQESSCFGVKYSKHIDEYGSPICLDCPSTHYCMGVPFNRMCYRGLIQKEGDIEWDEVGCESGVLNSLKFFFGI